MKPLVMKTSDLCDACEAALACVLPWRSYGLRRAFAGGIRTVRCHEDIALLREALARPGHGQVMVVDGGGSLVRALFGDRMAGVAIRNGWAGIVVNGAIRDVAELDTMDIGVKALGTVPRRGEIHGTGAVDEPVNFGGVTFTPGQELVADEDGLVVLPRGVSRNDIGV